MLTMYILICSQYIFLIDRLFEHILLLPFVLLMTCVNTNITVMIFNIPNIQSMIEASGCP